MLFVAMSALQGRPQIEAWDVLSSLAVDGVQLTPGNLPEPGFEARVRASGRPVRRHHGFSFTSYRSAVYDERGDAPRLPADWSIHPPPPVRVSFGAWLERARARDDLVECMVPGQHLGSGGELRAAMRVGLRLAVDVSHLHIQQRAGVLDDAVLARLFDYDRLEEIHVSHNDGRTDSHRPLAPDTPHLAWVRRRLEGGTPVIYESHLHRVDAEERHRQIAWVRS